MKEKTIPSIHKTLWKIFSIYIRQRDSDWKGNAKCCTCGEIHNWKEGDAGHYRSRAYKNTLYDERNVNFQCKRCNIMEGGGERYRQFLIKKYGPGIIDELLKLSLESKQWTIPELQAKIEYYKSKVQPDNIQY